MTFALLISDLPICVIIFMMLFMIIFTIFAFFNNVPDMKGKTFEERVFYKIEGVFKTFLTYYLFVGLFFLLIIIPIVYLIITAILFHFYLFNLGHVLGFTVVLICLFIITKGKTHKGMLKKRMWVTYCDVIPNLSIPPNIMTQNKLLNLLSKLKFLVGWISISALLLAFWGLFDILILFSFIRPNLAAVFIFFIPIVKISISFIMFIATYILMVRPLNKIKFWNNIMQG